MKTDDMSGGTEEAGVYQGVGRELRDVREAMGVRLEDVAGALRIQYDFLQALEEGRYADLPGAAYALGFLRTYGNYLGLSAERLVEEFKDEQDSALKPKPLHFPQPLEKSRRAPIALLVILLIVAMAIYGTYLARGKVGEWSFEDIVPAVPERLSKLLKDDPQPSSTVGKINARKVVATPVSAPPPAVAVPQNTEETTLVEAPRPIVAETDPKVAARDVESTRPEVAPAPTELVQDKNTADEIDTAPVQPAIQQALKKSAEQAEKLPTPAPPAPPAAPDLALDNSTNAAAGSDRSNALADTRTQTYGGANRGGRIVLIAREDSWIQVKSRDNELLITRVLQAGDRYLVPDRDDLLLTTGNAGGLEIVVDGKIAPSLGVIGNVSRDIVLQPAKLLPQ
jgi:cytoskeleton protein RodZ